MLKIRKGLYSHSMIRLRVVPPHLGRCTKMMTWSLGARDLSSAPLAIAELDKVMFIAPDGLFQWVVYDILERRPVVPSRIVGRRHHLSTAANKEDFPPSESFLSSWPDLPAERVAS